MPGDIGRFRLWIEACLGLQNLERGKACDHERRLGVRGQRELILWALEHEVRELLVQDRVDAVEDLSRNAKLVRQRFSHADRLGALTWKHQGRFHENGFPAWAPKDNSACARVGAQTRPALGCQARDHQCSNVLNELLAAKSVPERVPRIFQELAFGTDKRASADTRENAPGRTQFEARAEAAADDAFLHPDLAALQFPIGVEAGQLGAGSGSTWRPVISSARAENEVAAVRVVRSRGTKELDMVDQGAVLAAHALSLKRIANRGGRHRQRSHVREYKIARRKRSEEEPIAAPRDISAHGAKARNLDLNRFGETVALNILDRRRAIVDQFHADHADRGLEAMASGLEPAHMRKRHGKADRAVAAHADISDIVEEDDAGRT